MSISLDVSGAARQERGLRRMRAQNRRPTPTGAGAPTKDLIGSRTQPAACAGLNRYARPGWIYKVCRCGLRPTRW